MDVPLSKQPPLKKRNQLSGKILYALLFLALVPVLQWFWARLLDDFIHLPVLESRTIGMIIGFTGLLLMVWGMFSLKKFGKGLPMNAYPPAFFVKKGPYRFVRHPIYWGYGMLMTGFFIFIGSGCGLWIVTPISILCIIALVMGYENIDLKERFKDADMSVLLDIPTSVDKPILIAERVASAFWFITLLIASNIVVFVLTFETASVWNESWNISLFSKAIDLRFLALPYVLFVPLMINNRAYLRQWVIAVISGIALFAYFALLWPAAGSQYFYHIASTVANDKLAILFIPPVYLTLLAASAYFRQYKKWRWLILPITGVILFFQLVNSSTPVLNLLVSVFIFLVSANYKFIWSFIQKSAERIANSWKEWTLGPVRIINHGIYVGVGGFFGILFCGLLVGKAYAWALLFFAFVVIVFAALWAQLIEGSDKLKRPFGFYGALIGILFASIILWWMGYNVWLLIGIISVVMPWVQAIGRFRCLVNGCCHGKPTANSLIGIRYFHYRSRVCNISGLRGKYLHPTQLYSMLWLFLVGFVLLGLWQNGYLYPFIFGLYLILTGIGRFVEEAYRGEVQTPVWKGLRLYQWAAIASVLAGIFFTTLNVAIEQLQPEYGWEIWMAAFLGGFITFFAMGIDFPRSNARFSRLV